MFSHVNYSKLKTNLKLAVQRLKLLEKKKAENAKKFSKDIADFIAQNKYDRARIKVEHIIREDYTVEGMELVEMYNDLLLARFGLLESMKSLDPGLEECVSSIIWVAPRLESECQELKVVADELAHKFGKDYASECKSGRMKTISPRVMQRFSEQPPSKLLVEKYLFEIANSHKVQFKPDSEIALQDPEFFYNFSHSAPMPPPHQSNYNNDNNNNNAFGGNSGAGGGSAAPQMPIFPSPQISHIGFNTPVNNYPMKPVHKLKEPDAPPVEEEKLNLPDVPGSDSFDDLTKRFENLKKNK